MTTAEAMAIEVLKGDLAAARAMADLLTEQYGAGGAEVLPVRRFTAGRLQALVFLKDDAVVTDAAVRGVQDLVRGWLEGQMRDPLLLVGVERVEVYEFPV